LCVTAAAHRTYKIDSFVRYCRQIRAEPWIQVPLILGTPEQAADFVRYCNVQNNYNVKFWSIGNEPDLYQGTNRTTYTVNDYIADFKRYGQAMKAVDPYIKVIGPELSWKYQLDNPANNWLLPFLRGCGDIVDIVGLHRYPFDGRQSVSASMSDPPNVTPLIDRIRSEIRIAAGRDIPLIFSENNLTWDWTAQGDGSGASLYAGLWWLDILSRYMDRNLWMGFHWSLVNDSTLSLFAPSTRNPRPTFYAFDLLSHYFNWRLPAETNVSNFSAYASRNDGNESVALIVVNRSPTDITTAIRISGAKDFGPGTSYIWVSSAWATLDCPNASFPRYSMSCLQISQDGQTRKRWTYSLDEYNANRPPTEGAW
jgi:hypothetical protein